MMGIHGTFACADHGVLSLEEIAVGISREGRFGNQTTLHWTVADHLLACVHYHVSGYGLATLRSMLHVALHDAHEAMTRDTPTDLKTKQQRTLQRVLDKRLYLSLGILGPTREDAALIKEIDAMMLLAEASLVAPPATYDNICQEMGGRRATHMARRAVGYVLQQQRSEAETAAEWLRLVTSLLRGLRHAGASTKTTMKGKDNYAKETQTGLHVRAQRRDSSC